MWRKIKEIAASPYGRHNNVTKLQGREGYRLRIGDWHVIYVLHDDRLETGEDELVPLEIIERRLKGDPALRIWREHRKLTQEQLAKKAKVSRALIAAIETNRKTGSVSTMEEAGCCT